MTSFGGWRRALHYPMGWLMGGLLLLRHIKGGWVVWVDGRPMPKIINHGGLVTTEGCGLFSGVRLEVGPHARLSIGKGTYLNRNTNVICYDRVQIGRDCAISWDVVIMDTDLHDWPGIVQNNAPVVIGDGVWIGCRAIILKGVTIGDGAVVAAGSIVARNVPARALVAGQPARILRYLDEDNAAAAAGGGGPDAPSVVTPFRRP